MLAAAQAFSRACYAKGVGAGRAAPGAIRAVGRWDGGGEVSWTLRRRVLVKLSGLRGVSDRAHAAATEPHTTQPAASAPISVLHAI